MNRKNTLTLALALLIGGAGFAPHAVAADEIPSIVATASALEAAEKFLNTLDDAQRAKVVFEFSDDAQRKRWSNFPTGIFQRAGLRMGDLTLAQREAAMGLLKATLSSQGYDKITQIVEGDEVLKAGDSGNVGRGGGGGGPGGAKGPAGGKGPDGRGGKGGGLIFGHDNYYVAFLGRPSMVDPWMIQFGGHHLGINVTIVGPRGTVAPSHTGAQPAIYEIEGKTVRPLGREVDKAFALMSSFDETQRKQATLNFQMRDLALGPGRDGQMIQPEGIKGSALNERQQAMLIDLASEWTGILNDLMTRTKMAEMKKNIAETWFAWSGSTEEGKAAYFRIQGPTVLIEFAPQGMGGDPTRHIHTIYRDPTNEYGKKWSNP